MAVVTMMALLPMRSMAATATLSIEDFTIKGGETKTMLIDVNNADMQVTLVQFDMRLPEGLSVVMEDGDYAIDIAGRTTWKKHSVSVNLVDGLLRLMLHSNNREALSGTSGAVLSVKLTAASGFSSGNIQLENIKIVAPDANATTSKPGTYIYYVSDAVTLTAKSYTRQYGEANPTFGYEVTSGTITSGTPTITCSATATSPVGTYDIVIAKGSVTNSTVNLVKGTLTITKAPLTISAGDYTKVEGEANPTFTPTFSGFKNGETKSVLTKQPSFSCTATTASTPGSYPVTVSGAEAKNYSISYVNGTLTVTAKPVPEPYAVLSDNGKTVTFYYDGQKTNRGGIDINNSNSSSPYGTATTAIIDTSFADYRPTSTTYWFKNCSSLTSITGMENLHTDNVTDMSYMFTGCSGLTRLDLSGFRTDNVTSMYAMFEVCSSLKSLDVSGWSNDNVTDMKYMFSSCSSLTSLDVSGFKTDKVTDMEYMFSGCSSLKSLDVSGFKTGNVTSMGYMFNGCSGLTTLDLSGFKTDNVTSMLSMFYGCSSLTSLDLSGFKTDNVTSMGFMFCGCSNLTTIYVDNGWSTDKVTRGNNMFTNCTSLVGGKGTKYDASHTNHEYARIDKINSPGYLTEKQANGLKGDVNGDGEVNGTDLVALVNIIMRENGVGYSAADVNSDGEVNGTDLVTLVNIIMAAKPARHLMAAESRGHGSGAQVAIGAAIGSAMGDTRELTLTLSNRAMDVTMAQMDVTLPKGMRLADADNGAVMAGRTSLYSHSLYVSSNADDNTVRLMLASGRNALIEGTEGTIIRLTVTTGADFEGGDIVVGNMLCTSPDLTEARPQPVTLHLAADGSTTGIAEMERSGEDESFYNLGGQRMSAPRKGVNIIDGRKVVVK